MPVLENEKMKRLPSSYGQVDCNESRTKWAFADKSQSIDLKTAPKDAILWFKLGAAANETSNKLDRGELVPANHAEYKNEINYNMYQTETGYFSPNATVNPVENTKAHSNGASQENPKVNKKTNGKPNMYPSASVPSDINRLNSTTIGYSDTSIPSNINGFTDKIIIALLSGIGIGIISAIVYIFINLGKVSISI